MTKIAILGAGMMGTAFATPLADRGHDVHLIGTPLDEEIVRGLRATGVHPKMGTPLPAGVTPHAVAELPAAAADADVLVLGVSSAGIPWACEALRPLARVDRPIAMITKGLVVDDDRVVPLPDVVQRALPDVARDQVFPVAVAGPCIAGELARRAPSVVVLTGRHQPTLDRLRALFETDYYVPLTSLDVEGVEVCAALKNAFAMGVALPAGMHEARGGAPGSVAMHNLESAVFAQAVIEMSRVVVAVGGRAETALGLPGAGDLDVTCNGGRTGRFGRFLGLGIGLAEAVRRMEGATLECLEILAVLRRAVPALEASGRLAPGSLPLLSHLMEVALDGAPVALPITRFGATA